MRILITNDDGIHAEGLSVLERIARKLSSDVWVVAPENDQSGYAHSLTLSLPLRLRKIDDRHFALNGTPADCVIMGVRNILPSPPDLVLSGVNAGANLADDLISSGTVAGAMEGTMLGIRSISLNQAVVFEDGYKNIPYKTCESLAPELLNQLIKIDFPEGVFVNVNYPGCFVEDVAGIQVTKQGRMSYVASLDQRHDSRGVRYFWLRFEKNAASDLEEGTDSCSVSNGFVSITPLHLDLTAHAFRENLKNALG